MLKIENPLKTNVFGSDENGTHSDVNLNFFMERYKASYLVEMQAFIDALTNNTEMLVNGKDGINDIVLADAAYKSLIENRPVKIG